MGTVYGYVSDLNLKPSKKTATKEYVYFIADRNGNCKIGKAYDTLARLNELQVGNPSKLSIFVQLEVPKGKALRVEKDVHELLCKHKIRGEWYNLKGCVELLKSEFDAGGYRFTPFSESQLQQWTDELCGGETA